MKFYWGNVGSNEVIEYMQEHNHRTLITSPHYRFPRTEYSLDNGAFSDWKHNREFRSEEFLEFLEKYEQIGKRPEWVAIPDRVTEGNISLEFSISWIDKIPDYFDRLLLVVQDGMDRDRVSQVLEDYDRVIGLFIGGSKRWKIDTAEDWVELAHKHNGICHIGRIGRWNEIMWAERIGADSIDSTSWPQNYEIKGDFHIQTAKKQSFLEVEG